MTQQNHADEKNKRTPNVQNAQNENHLAAQSRPQSSGLRYFIHLLPGSDRAYTVGAVEYPHRGRPRGLTIQRVGPSEYGFVLVSVTRDEERLRRQLQWEGFFAECFGEGRLQSNPITAEQARRLLEKAVQNGFLQDLDGAYRHFGLSADGKP